MVSSLIFQFVFLLFLFLLWLPWLGLPKLCWIILARVTFYNEVSPHISQNGHHWRNLYIINSGEGVEKREPSYTGDRNVNLQLLWRRAWRFLKKLNIKLPYEPATPLLGIYPEQVIIQKDTSPQCSVQSLSCVQLFTTPWTAARQASLSITNSQSLLKLMPIESVMPSNHLILCYPLLILPSIFPSIRVFSNESVHRIRWPKYWSLSLSISPSNEYSGLISFRIDWFDLLAVQGTLNSQDMEAT